MVSARNLWLRIVEGRWADTLANNLGLPGGRKQQLALDLERLALVTRMWTLLRDSGGAPLSSTDFQYLVAEVRSEPTSQHREQVAACIEQQITHISSILHQQLLQVNDANAGSAMQAAYQRMTSDKDQEKDPRAQGSTPEQGPEHNAVSSQGAEHFPAQQLSISEVSRLLEEKLGYSVRVAPSRIQHPFAGHGVFVSGTAPVGSVIALVPGLTYARTQLSRMPNYPQISMGNDYLSSRYDMTIIDSLPWKHYTEQQGQAAAPKPPPAVTASTPVTPSMHDQYARWVLGGLETRHPLAMGHMVNHPGLGQQPNVLEVSLDMHLDLKQQPAWIRAYLPNAAGLDLDMTHKDAAQVKQSVMSHCLALLNGLDAEKQGKGTRLLVRGLALVATRTIKEGEEVLQNYRLNPHAPRPSWYTPYDLQEEQRRWAPLAFARLFS